MSFYFFADISKLNIQSSDAFGPAPNTTISDVDYEQFLVTSMHTASDSVDAVAVCKGQVFLQEQTGNNDLLNIVLKPIENLPFSFPKIKYFIYKGVAKDSLIASDDQSIADASLNDLTNKIWTAFNSLNLPGNPSKSLFGLDDSIDNLSDEYLIDDIFNGNFNNVEFLTVIGGDKIGKFDKTAIGFEIVLESINYFPSLIIARNNQTIVQSEAIISSPLQKDFFEHWHKKELIIHFVDPCAFFGSFYNSSLNVVSGESSNQWSGENLYNNLLTKFFNKNATYIDIRNEFNFSLNFFKNYGASASDNTTNILVKKGDYDAFTIDYYSNSWPILMLDESDFSDSGSLFQTISLQLPIGNGDNPLPLVYLNNGYTPTTYPTEVSGKSKFLNLSVNDNFSDSFKIAVPWDGENIICSYTLIKYNKQISDQELPPPVSTQIRKNDYLDGLFSPTLNFNPQSSILFSKVFDEEIYIDASQLHFFDAAFNIGISFDSLNVALFANPYILNNSNVTKERKAIEVTSDFSSINENSTANAFQEFGINEGGAKLTVVPLNLFDNTIINLLQYETSGADVQEIFEMGDTRKILGFNITILEWTSVVQQANLYFAQQYPIYLMISDKQLMQDTDGITYTSLTINIAGFVLNGDNVSVSQISTNINLNAYGNF